MAVANVVVESCWVCQLLIELHRPLRVCTVVYYDNVSVVYLSAIPVQHKCTKHVEIDIHFVRDKVALGEVRVLHVPSSSQYTDIFTKGLPSQLFSEFRSSLNITPLLQRCVHGSNCVGVLEKDSTMQFGLLTERLSLPCRTDSAVAGLSYCIR